MFNIYLISILAERENKYTFALLFHELVIAYS